MRTKKEAPFALKSIIVPEIRASRSREIPEKITFEVQASLGVAEENYPESFEVLLRLQTADNDLPYNIAAMVVALYELEDKEAKPTRQDLADFVTTYALNVLWIELNRVIRHITVDWGIDPVRLPFKALELVWPPSELKKTDE